MVKVNYHHKEIDESDLYDLMASVYIYLLGKDKSILSDNNSYADRYNAFLKESFSDIYSDIIDEFDDEFPEKLDVEDFCPNIKREQY